MRSPASLTSFIRIWLAALCALLAVPCLAGGPAPERHRTAIPLDAGWRCALQGAESARTLTLPHRWEPETISAASYTRELTFPAEMSDAGGWLVIQNPVGVLDVRLDGQVLERALGNGLTRRVRLRGKAGTTHQLELRLESAGLPASLRASACGLGPVGLEVAPVARIEALLPEFNPTLHSLTVSYRLAADAPETATLRLRVTAPRARRPLMDQTVPVALPAGTLTGDRTVTLRGFVPWSPDAPTVYRLEAILARGARVFDKWELPCGLCELVLNGAGARVNGKPVTLKGVRLRGGLPPLTGGSLADTLERELRLARQAGFNAIMAEGAALPEEALTLADTLGLLVIADVPQTWGAPPADGAPPTPVLDLGGMLEQYGHHPSLAAWSWADPGTLRQDLIALRLRDRVRYALVRAGATSQAYGPFPALGKPFADLDTECQPLSAGAWSELLAKADTGKLPLLASGLGGDGADPRCLEQLCADVETVRRTLLPLGYFVRPPRGTTLTGLGDPDGMPTRLFITAASYNQPCMIVLRPARALAGNRLALDAVLINDQSLTGDFRLFGLVSTPKGATSLIQQTITLTGNRVQTLAPLAAQAFQQPGTYRIQLALADGENVLTSAQLSVEVPE
jgi:hypothetical protein